MPTASEALHQQVVRTVGEAPETWPGGWPGEIEAALIDAVFSVRARYGNRATGTGVYGAVNRWRDYRGVRADDLRALATTDEALLRELTNSGRISQRSKASVVIDAATSLVSLGVVHASDLDTRMDAAQRAYTSVRGCGPVTWAYFRMLLGQEDVKPDTWVMRFVREAVPGVTSTADASLLVKEVAKQMNVRATDLDHAIWRHQRAKGSGAVSSDDV